MNDPMVYRTYLNGLVRDQKYVKIQFFTELHELMTVNAIISTIRTDQSGVDWVTLTMGETFLLDQLVSAGGSFAPTYTGYQLYCETCDC